MSQSPPKLFLRFFRWYCHPKLLKYIEGDLMELYDERVKEFGKRKADRKFIKDVLLLFRPGIIKPAGVNQTLNNTNMIGNYFRIGLRNIVKYKAFSFINVFGLSIAMSICLLVILMLADQNAYDNFHSNGDRVYRILSERPYSSMPFASTPPSLTANLHDEYSLVEDATHLILSVGGDVSYDHRTTEMRGFFADENFLNVFGYELEYGHKSTALSAPNALVISADIARILFDDENPVGKTVEFTDRGLHYMKSGKDSNPVAWGSYTITGVLAAREYKSHLKFNVLMSTASMDILIKESKLHIGDGWDKAFTYVRLVEGKTKEDLDASLQDLYDHKYAANESYKDHRFEAQALSAITPGVMVNQPPSIQLPVESYYFLGFIALAIMLSACLNYTNLSTARALTRAKEIGVRKVTGAVRRDLIFQFLSESILTSLFALALAILFLTFIKPAFTNLWLNRYLNFDLYANPSVYLIFAAFAIVMGIVAGVYPAFHLSSFHPIKAIKNTASVTRGKLGIRKILSVSQFVISLFFVITSILIYKQFKFFARFEYGFDFNDIVNISLQGNDYQKISTAFNTVPGVSDISASEYVPGTGRSSGMDINHPDSQEPINFRILSANERFLDNLDLKIIAGTGLPSTMDSLGRSIVVNETAVKALGFAQPSDVVGITLTQTWNKEPLEVVGVVEDFWIKLPIGGDLMDPAFLRNQSQFSYANVKIVSASAQETLRQLEQAWKKMDPDHPFRFEYYDEALAATHAGIFDIVTIVGFLAFIAVTIACLGMLGMATYSVERKRKEVGIRKVMGAQNTSIALMLSNDFLRVLIIATCIGAPLTYLVNNFWLQQFRVRADFGFEVILMGTLLLFSLGLLVIGSQTISAAKRSPIQSLKSD